MNEFDEMTPEKLRAEVNKFLNPAPQVRKPLPPGFTADDTQQAQDTATELYTGSIMSKKATAINPDERAFLRDSIIATLREMGQ